MSFAAPPASTGSRAKSARSAVASSASVVATTTTGAPKKVGVPMRKRTALPRANVPPPPPPPREATRRASVAAWAATSSIVTTPAATSTVPAATPLEATRSDTEKNAPFAFSPPPATPLVDHPPPPPTSILPWPSATPITAPTASVPAVDGAPTPGRDVGGDDEVPTDRAATTLVSGLLAAAVDRRTHANLARCYLDSNAADALDETVAQVSGNVRIVARRALRRDELVYRGSPLMHVHSADPKTVLLFVGELPDDLTRRLDAVTKNLYPTNDTQTAGFVRRHVLPYFFGPDRPAASLPAALGVPASRTVPLPPTELKLDTADVPFVDAWRRTDRLQIRLAARLLYNGLCSNMGESESTVVEDDNDDGDDGSGGADRKMKSSPPAAAAASDKKRHESWRWAKNWYLGASKFNHSCHPNCMLVQGSNNALAIHTTCEVGEGEELTLPYWFVRGELFFGASDARRQDFIRAVAYAGFDCKCYICRAQASGGGGGGGDVRKVPRPVDYLINLPDPDLYPQLRRRGPWCANCGKQCIGASHASAPASKADSAFWCRACLAVVYCGAECQREHWRDAHRAACARTYSKRAQMRPLVLKFVTRQPPMPATLSLEPPPPAPPSLLLAPVDPGSPRNSSSPSSSSASASPNRTSASSDAAPTGPRPPEIVATPPPPLSVAVRRRPTLLSPWGLAIEPRAVEAPPEDDADAERQHTDDAAAADERKIVGVTPIDFNEPPSGPPPMAAAFSPPPFPVSAATFSALSASPPTSAISFAPISRSDLRRPHSTSTPRSRPSPSGKSRARVALGPKTGTTTGGLSFSTATATTVTATPWAGRNISEIVSTPSLSSSFSSVASQHTSR